MPRILHGHAPVIPRGQCPEFCVCHVVEVGMMQQILGTRAVLARPGFVSSGPPHRVRCHPSLYVDEVLCLLCRLLFKRRLSEHVTCACGWRW